MGRETPAPTTSTQLHPRLSSHPEFPEVLHVGEYHLISNLYSHPIQDVWSAPGMPFFPGTAVGHCQNQPEREPITIGPYALKERPSEDCVYTERGPNPALTQSGELPK